MIQAGLQWNRGSIPDMGRLLSLSKASRPVLGSTKTPILWVPVIFSQGLHGQDVKRTFHFIDCKGEEWMELCSRINSTKSPVSGAGNVSEPRRLSRVEKVRVVVCA